MRRRTVALLAAGAGLCLGLAVAGAAVWLWNDDDDPPRDDHVEAASQFIAAWARSRTGTFVVQSDFHRETSRGGELDSEVVLVQRPPDYLLHQFGGVEGRIDDRLVGCTEDPDGQSVCRPSDDRTETSYDEKVADEVANFVGYFFFGKHPLYRVSRSDDGCFDLTLTRLFPSPPYGNEARFCFDEATGALSFVRIERDEGTDVTEAVDIRTDVTDADFQLTE